jgi:type IV pilus assembly protein PilN
VKPIHLNLASRPYRDYRPVYAVVVGMSLLAAFLMLNNVETYFRYIRETQSTRAKIETVEAQARSERERADIAQRRIKNLDLALLDRQTRFINAKLAERAFSWSTLLDELESVVADDVRLVSVAPTFGENGEINLDMSFQAKTGDGMLSTIRRMQNDPQFRDPFPRVESQMEGGYQFQLTAKYLPPAMQPADDVVRTSTSGAKEAAR